MSNLKKDNNKQIFYILTSVILLALLVQFGVTGFEKWKEFVIASAFSPFLTALLIMLTNLIGHNIKHKLVFTRLKNEMPGSRCHLLCKQDPRLDQADISSKWPDVFSDSTSKEDRNGLWYREIYKGVRDRPEVLQAHGNFLLYRDAFSGLIGITAVISCWDSFGPVEIIGEINPWVYAVFGVSLVLTMVTARNSGNRFVVNAVAAAI